MLVLVLRPWELSTQGSVLLPFHHHMRCANHVCCPCTCTRVGNVLRVWMPTGQDHNQKWSSTPSPIKHVADLQEVESWCIHSRIQCKYFTTQTYNGLWLGFHCPQVSKMCNSLGTQVASAPNCSVPQSRYDPALIISWCGSSLDTSPPPGTLAA